MSGCGGAAVQVLTTPGLWVPLVHVQGVYVLPGIPRLFTAMVEANKERFRGPQHHTLTLYTHLGEGDVAGALARPRITPSTGSSTCLICSDCDRVS